MKPAGLRVSLRGIAAAAVLMAGVIIPGQASAAGAVVFTAVGPGQVIAAGSQFTVSVTVQPNNAIAGAQFSLSFNPALVTANSVTEGNLMKQGGATTYFQSGQIDNVGGTITGIASVITTPGRTVSASGTLATITFTADPAKGTSSLNLSNLIAGDINGQPLAASAVNGQASVDRSPVLTAIGSKSVNEGTSLSFTISGSDPDGDALNYSASNLPTGATFTASTRTFAWTPTTNQAGTYPNVRFQVSDGSLTAFENVTITVTNVDRPPVLTAIGAKSVNEGALLSFTISGSDPDGDTLTYSASNLPTGATFNASTRTFTWTPTYSQSGTYQNVRFQVSDGTLTASENIVITVVEQYSNWDPNTDGVVNVLDMISVGQHFGETGAAGWIRQDANGDGVINVQDMIVIGQHWTG